MSLIYEKIHAAVRKPSTGIMLILTAAALVYSLSLANGFVWDDWELIVGNKVYQRFDLRAIFFGKANALEYLPIRDLSLALDAQLWGMRPFGFHLTNLLLYLASLAALHALVRQLAVLLGNENEGPPAFWATLIFALHPVHAEVVNFVTARNTLLAGLFLFLSAASLVRGVREKRPLLIGTALLGYLLAVFSKAIAVFFPAFLLVLLIIMPKDLASFRTKTMVFLGFLVVTAGAVWVHAVNAAETGVMNDELLRYGVGNRWLVLAKAVQIPFFYFRMLVLPYPVSVEYSTAFLSGHVLARAMAAGMALAAGLAVAWHLRKRAPMATLGAAWCIASLGPVLNLFPTHPVVADRYAYFSVAGFGMLCASLLARPAAGRRAAMLTVLGALVVWAGIDVTRTRDWRSDVALWSSAVAADANTSRINLAQALWREGRYDAAIAHLRAERLAKGTHYASLYEGMLLMRNGRVDEAIQMFQRSLAEGGDAFRDVQLSLAQAYERRGDGPKALDHYLKAVSAKSIDVDSRYEKDAQAGVERIRSHYAGRLAELREQVRERPRDPGVRSAAALAFHALGLYEEAEREHRTALDIDPARWDVWYNLGLTQVREQRFAAAALSFEKAVALNPGNANALNNLGICFLHLKDYRRAEQAYRRALDIDPGFIFAAFNLGRLYFITGDGARAREFLGRARILAAQEPAIQSRIDQYLARLQ